MMRANRSPAPMPNDSAYDAPSEWPAIASRWRSTRAAPERLAERRREELDVRTVVAEHQIPRALVARVGREDDDAELVGDRKRVRGRQSGAAGAVKHDDQRQSALPACSRAGGRARRRARCRASAGTGPGEARSRGAPRRRPRARAADTAPRNARRVICMRLGTLLRGSARRNSSDDLDSLVFCCSSAAAPPR